MDVVVPLEPRFTALIARDGKWWIGWVQEVRGVCSQGHTRAELLRNLRSALDEAFDMEPERTRMSDSSK